MSLNHIHLNVSVKSRKTHFNEKSTNAVGSAAYRYKNTFTSHLGMKFDYSYREKEFVEGFLMLDTKIQQAILENPTKNLFSRAFNQIKQDKTLSIQEKHAEASNQLWNLVEVTEKRKDAQLFREVELSLYHSLSLEENKKILQKFVKENFVDRGMIADVCIHDSGGKGSNKNLHAHIMLTMRDFDYENVCFGKKNRTWNDLGLVEKWRKSWTDISNEALTKANQNTVEHKSFQRLAEQAALEGKFDLADAYIELDQNKAFHYSSTKKTKKQAINLSLKRGEKILPSGDHSEKPVSYVKYKLALLDGIRLYGGNFQKNKIKIAGKRQKLAENREKIYEKIKEIKNSYDTVKRVIEQVTKRINHRRIERRNALSLSLSNITKRSKVFEYGGKTDNKKLLQPDSTIKGNKSRKRYGFP